MTLKVVTPLLALASVLVTGCNSDPRQQKANAQAASAAQQVYVAYYYAFLSGGQSGSVFVYGIPSCRFIKEIPIFEPRAALSS